MKQYILDRAKEPSSWRGLMLILTAIGVPLAPAMADAIISVGLAVAGLIGVPGLGAYCTAKGGVRLMTKAAAIECARLGYGIRVNSIHPAIIRTRMGDEVVQGLVDCGLAPDPETAEAAIASLHPMGYGQPRDVASAVHYLASPAARWINGAELVLDGGLTAC